MALRYLLHTDTVSFLIRSPSPALQRRFKRTQADQVALSVVTEMEIRFGLARNPGLRIAGLLESFLDGMTILPLTSDDAPAYARIRAVLEAKGTPIGPHDLMIAAQAVARRLTLVSRNLAEFRRVPELRCRDWTR